MAEYAGWNKRWSCTHLHDGLGKKWCTGRPGAGQTVFPPPRQGSSTRSSLCLEWELRGRQTTSSDHLPQPFLQVRLSHYHISAPLASPQSPVAREHQELWPIVTPSPSPPSRQGTSLYDVMRVSEPRLQLHANQFPAASLCKSVCCCPRRALQLYQGLLGWLNNTSSIANSHPRRVCFECGQPGHHCLGNQGYVTDYLLRHASASRPLTSC